LSVTSRNLGSCDVIDHVCEDMVWVLFECYQ
jgi:hypothetical protein